MTATAPPPGFAVVWDSDGTRVRALSAWAEEQGAIALFSSGPVAAFSLGVARSSIIAWSNEQTSGAFLGEIHAPEQVQGALLEAGRPVEADAASIVAASYAEWGEAGLARLEGVFCTVLWDALGKQLVLYRDGSCGRALYCGHFEGGATVATRLDILGTMPGIPAQIGDPGLHEYLRFLDISPPNTLFAGIQALEPGRAALFRGTTLEYPGSPACTVARKRPVTGSRAVPSFDACVDALDEALHASVAARLDRDRPTGVFLSGGIDSSLVCAIAADIDRERIDAFTLGFQGRDYDETPVASRIADHLGVRHHRMTYGMAQYAQAFDDFVSGIDLPFADPAGLPTLLLYRECRKTVHAVLDGTGADTLLGVMPARHARLATQYATLLPRGIRQAMGRLVRALPPVAGYAPLLEFDTPEDLLIRWKGWQRSEIEALCSKKVDLAGTRFFRIYRQFARAEHLERYSALLGNLPDDRVHQAAELSALGVRFPYWDKRVERFIEGLPQPYRYREAEPKRLLRALLARYVPRHVWDVPKHGFDFPFAELLRFDDGALSRRYLDRRVLDRHGLLRSDMVRHCVAQFDQGDDSQAFRVWALVILFGWLEHHRR